MERVYDERSESLDHRCSQLAEQTRAEGDEIKEEGARRTGAGLVPWIMFSFVVFVAGMVTGIGAVFF